MDKIFFCLDEENHLYIFVENNKSKYRRGICLSHKTEVHIIKKIKRDIELDKTLKYLNDYELFFNNFLEEQIKNIIINYFISINNNHYNHGISIWRTYKIKKHETAMNIYKSILKTLYKKYKPILDNESEMKEYFEKLKSL